MSHASAKRESRARGRPRQHRDDRLRHQIDAAGGVSLRQTLRVDAFIERRAAARAAFRHTFDVAAGAEAAAGAGQHDAANARGAFRIIERARHAVEHLSGQCVAPFGAIHRQHRDAVGLRGEQMFGASFDLAHLHPPRAVVRPLESRFAPARPVDRRHRSDADTPRRRDRSRCLRSRRRCTDPADRRRQNRRWCTSAAESRRSRSASIRRKHADAVSFTRERNPHAHRRSTRRDRRVRLSRRRTNNPFHRANRRREPNSGKRRAAAVGVIQRASVRRKTETVRQLHVATDHPGAAVEIDQKQIAGLRLTAVREYRARAERAGIDAPLQRRS